MGWPDNPIISKKKPRSDEDLLVDADSTEEELLSAITEELGIPRTGEKLKPDVDLKEEYKIGQVVRYRGRHYCIASSPYISNHREVIDLVCSINDLDDPEKRDRVPLIEIVPSRKTLVNRDRMVREHAIDPDRHGLPIMTTADIRYSKMTLERQRQIAEDPVFAKYVDKYPYRAEIYYETLPCTVKLSPYKTKEGKILVKIKSDDEESAGFSTKVVPVEDIILRSDVVQYY
ncbi:MAG: hypothetical protein V1898_03105 [Patescibacteria group bacterium]